MSEFTFNPIGGYVFVALVALVLFGLLWIGPERARTTRRQRAALAGLRAGVVLLILLAMLRPARVVTETIRQSATLVVLVDRSRSMLVTDEIGGKSRWEALRTVLVDAAPTLRELREDLEIKLYAFDSEVQPLELTDEGIQLPPAPPGEQSAIGAAIEDVLRRETGKRILGIIMLSDGAQRAYAPRDTPPQMAVRRLADLGYPLYTFAFGQSRGLGQARDVAIKELISNPTVFVKNQFDVAGALRVDGYVNQKIPVQLLFETAPGQMEPVASVQITASGDGEQLPLALSYVPQVPGEYKVTLKAADQDGELVTTNNELSTFVTVLKGGINVLYLGGAVRVEQRFLRSALDASPDVKVDYERFDHRSLESWPAEAGDRFDPGKYDVYILGDLDSSVWKNSSDWQKLADRVEQGAGLIMLGGYHSFGPGGYQHTALGDVLPVAIDRLERQPFDEPISKDLHVEGPIKMVPSERFGSRHPVMYLGQDNLAQWRQLPTLDGANKFRAIKPGAVVLAETERAKRWPLLVAGQWGSGRVLAFAGDSTWHWHLEGYGKEHRRFWRQVVLWLARKDEATEGHVWIKLAARRLQPGSRLTFTAGADTAEGEPVTGATLEAEIVLPDGSTRRPRLVREGQGFSGSFVETQQAGDYTIVVTAKSEGARLGTARSRFLVHRQDLELDNPAADPSLLASLARTTADDGGKALAAEELPDLLRQLREAPADLEVPHETRTTYWDRWPLLLLFVGLIGSEWYLRKKWGLV